jgi:TldD protein
VRGRVAAPERRRIAATKSRVPATRVRRVRDLCRTAVDAALGAGAEYADARAVIRRNQSVATKNGRVEALMDSESEGIGVRVLVGGAWGFACDRRLSAEGARDAAVRACVFAKAAAGPHTRSLAPVEGRTGSYATPVERDPFELSLAAKVDQCLRAEEALQGPNLIVRQAMVRAQREHKVLVSSEGTDVEQELTECGGGLDCAAARDGVFQTRSYPSAHVGSSAQGGWECVDRLQLEHEAPRVAEQVEALLTADVCPSLVTTIVLDADQVALQVHESVGHPTELDRIYGTEASYAGTSFLKPDDLRSLRYGSERMNITADPTTPGGLGTFGFDDEGVAAARRPIVEAGVLAGFLTSRETAARIGAGDGGSMRADGWNRMPLVRMTNLHLEPGEGTLEDLLADVSDGIYMETNKSWSIDDKRLNFQFGTQIAWEIKDGKLGRMLRDATYTGITPQFWSKLDAVGGPESWRLYGLTNCGKGQPGQSAHVSHGAAPARFRDVEVGVKS